MRDSRTEKRATFDAGQRIVLLEQDADVFEANMASIAVSLKRLTAIAFGSVLSFATATVLLAIDIVTRSTP